MVLEDQISFLKNVIPPPPPPPPPPKKKYFKLYSIVLFSTVQFMWDSVV